MVVVGTDVHKRTHTFVGVDEAARELGQKTFPATTAGHLRRCVGPGNGSALSCVWAVEDCRHLSARLERDLLTAGQKVVRVPPKMMALTRRIARTRGKSDPIDACAVARAALREPDLPVASHDEVSRQLRLLVDRREDLVDNAPRRSTGCCGGSTSSIPPGPRRRRRWIWPSTAASCKRGCDSVAGLVAELAATSSPTSPGSPSAINALANGSSGATARSPRACWRCPASVR